MRSLAAFTINFLNAVLLTLKIHVCHNQMVEHDSFYVFCRCWMTEIVLVSLFLPPVVVVILVRKEITLYC